MRRAGLPSAHQCLDGRDCYVASLYLTLGACVVALGLSVWAGWRDSRDRRARGPEVLVEEVVWEVPGAEE